MKWFDVVLQMSWVQVLMHLFIKILCTYVWRACWGHLIRINKFVLSLTFQAKFHVIQDYAFFLFLFFFFDFLDGLFHDLKLKEKRECRQKENLKFYTLLMWRVLECNWLPHLINQNYVTCCIGVFNAKIWLLIHAWSEW